MKTWKVYGLVDPRDEQIRYIGCSSLNYLSNRLASHLTVARHENKHGYNSPRSAWMREVLAAGLRPQIVQLQACFSEEEGYQIETEWIARLGAELVNQSSGGSGLKNPSPATRAKLSANSKQVWAKRSPEERKMFIDRLWANSWTPEANAKRGNSHRGYKHTPETLERMRKARIGRKLSPEHRKHISEAQRRRRKREREDLAEG